MSDTNPRSSTMTQCCFEVVSHFFTFGTSEHDYRECSTCNTGWSMMRENPHAPLPYTRPHLWGSLNNGKWEYIDTATKDTPKDVLLREYRMAFSAEWKFRWSMKGE